MKIVKTMIICMLIVSLSACSTMNTATPAALTLPQGKAVKDVQLTPEAKRQLSQFYMTLFSKCQDDDNVLISPMSILYAMAMTANGADGETLKELENVLAQGQSIEQLNGYLKRYLKEIMSEQDEDAKFKMANSLWYNESNGNVEIKAPFLQTVADYYDASIFKSKFSDKTKDEINQWITEHTDQMINNMIDRLDSQTFMVLVNALVFDAKWLKTFEEYQVSDGVFNNIDGTTSQIEFMSDRENSYYQNDSAVGFAKPYANGRYSFVAILPKDEQLDIEAFIDELPTWDYEAFLTPVDNVKVDIEMPKFKYEYACELVDVFKSLGIAQAFDESADFSKMVTSDLPVYIGKVSHKTYIENSELGTKAGAATVVEMICGSMPPQEEIIEHVKLDRPFVYMIIDNSYQLPIFIGAIKAL